jgi:hypothetical protein
MGGAWESTDEGVLVTPDADVSGLEIALDAG